MPRITWRPSDFKSLYSLRCDTRYNLLRRLLRVLSSPYQPSEISCRISICPSPSWYDLPGHHRILHLTKTWANDELGGERVQADWDHMLITSADYPEGISNKIMLIMCNSIVNPKFSDISFSPCGCWKWERAWIDFSVGSSLFMLVASVCNPNSCLRRRCSNSLQQYQLRWADNPPGNPYSNLLRAL
jgi:hypothetical protein